MDGNRLDSCNDEEICRGGFKPAPLTKNIRIATIPAHIPLHLTRAVSSYKRNSS